MGVSAYAPERQARAMVLESFEYRQPVFGPAVVGRQVGQFRLWIAPHWRRR